MTDIKRFKSDKEVVPPNRRFETRQKQAPRSNTYRVYLITCSRRQKQKGGIMTGKVTTAWVQTEVETERLYWNPMFYAPYPDVKNQRTFEAFGKTWSVFKSDRKDTAIPTWVFTAEYDDSDLAKPGSVNVPKIPQDLLRVILEN